MYDAGANAAPCPLGDHNEGTTDPNSAQGRAPGRSDRRGTGVNDTSHTVLEVKSGTISSTGWLAHLCILACFM